MDENTTKKHDFLVHLLFLAAVCAIIYLSAKYILAWVLPLLIGFVITLILRPLVEFVSNKTGINYKLACMIILIFSYILLAGVITLVFAFLLAGIRGLFVNLPEIYRSTLLPFAKSIDTSLENIYSNISPTLRSSDIMEVATRDFQKWIISAIGKAAAGLGSLTAKIPTILMTLFFSVICSGIILPNYGEISRFFVKQLPDNRKGILFSVKEGVLSAIGGYLRTYLIFILLTFVQLVVGLSFLEVENPIAMAGCIALFDMLPFIGAGTVLIPWALISFLQQNTIFAVGLLILWGIIFTIHNLLEPRLIGGQLGLNPLLSVCSVYFGYQIGGFWGMLLTPLIIQLIVRVNNSGAVNIWK